MNTIWRNGKNVAAPVHQVTFDSKDGDEDVQVVEEVTFQVPELYAILWSHEQILHHFLEVLSVLKLKRAETERIHKGIFVGMIIIINTILCVNAIVWSEKSGLKACVTEILTLLISNAQTSLNMPTQQSLKTQVERLQYVSPSFEYLLSWLQNTSDAAELNKKWDLLRLEMLCFHALKFEAEMDILDVINTGFADGKFDNFDKFNALLKKMEKLISKLTRHDEQETNSIMQWFVQNYLNSFAFDCKNDTNPRQISDHFVETMVQILAGEKVIHFEVVPNDFTKMEIAIQFMTLLLKVSY
ncbi:hypothetical protein RFI_20212 [Reticulomyxa filosa]|uniref:Uncharacterized protein n=1 Tax=Reticulomyxa filosa TaxID=46433 RepID=X6MUJ5_RETFI|nr:hypothetical protein RFI_20212 [Reticulomyxa filosa]|eukprot:ETO17122.1 hypothetical protein RFI_20212 [Reticulomyxa filosa]